LLDPFPLPRPDGLRSFFVKAIIEDWLYVKGGHLTRAATVTHEIGGRVGRCTDMVPTCRAAWWIVCESVCVRCMLQDHPSRHRASFKVDEGGGQVD